MTVPRVTTACSTQLLPCPLDHESPRHTLLTLQSLSARSSCACATPGFRAPSTAPHHLSAPPSLFLAYRAPYLYPSGLLAITQPLDSQRPHSTRAVTCASLAPASYERQCGATAALQPAPTATHLSSAAAAHRCRHEHICCLIAPCWSEARPARRRHERRTACSSPANNKRHTCRQRQPRVFDYSSRRGHSC